MSSIARWSYVNVARVKPFESEGDTWQGKPLYGEEYEILCDFAIKSEQMRDDRGMEFVSRHIIYTEDKRPKFRDLILLPMSAGWEEIRAHAGWPMGAFGEPDSPDFRMVT